MTFHPLSPLVRVLPAQFDAALLSALQSAFPELAFEPSDPRLPDWFSWLEQSDLGGFIVDTDACSSETLRLLKAAHEHRPKLQSLLLVGSRGLAGNEELLLQPNITLLPQPWTPAALAACLQEQAEVPSVRQIPDEDFLEGLVEDFRDALTASQSYLQMSLEGLTGEAKDMVESALLGHKFIENRLQALLLSSGKLGSHPTLLNLKDIYPDLQESNLFIESDKRILAALVPVAISWLERFGTGGSPEQSLTHKNGKVRLSLQLPPGKNPSKAVAPPPFLSIVLTKLAALLPAKLELHYQAEVIPTGVSLIWDENSSVEE